MEPVTAIKQNAEKMAGFQIGIKGPTLQFFTNSMLFSISGSLHWISV